MAKYKFDIVLKSSYCVHTCYHEVTRLFISFYVDSKMGQLPLRPSDREPHIHRKPVGPAQKEKGWASTHPAWVPRFHSLLSFACFNAPCSLTSAGVLISARLIPTRSETGEINGGRQERTHPTAQHPHEHAHVRRRCQYW